MQRLTELEGKPAAGHVSVGAAEHQTVLSNGARDAGPGLPCRTSTLPWWRPSSLLCAGSSGWLRAPAVGYRGIGSAHRCREPSPAELTTPFSFSTGWQCLPSATAAQSCRCHSTHHLGEQPKPPGWRVPGQPVLRGARAWPLGTACGDRDMGHPGQEGLLAGAGTSSTSRGALCFGVALGSVHSHGPVSQCPPCCCSSPRGATAAAAVPPMHSGQAWWEICFLVMPLGQESRPAAHLGRPVQCPHHTLSGRQVTGRCLIGPCIYVRGSLISGPLLQKLPSDASEARKVAAEHQTLNRQTLSW